MCTFLSNSVNPLTIGIIDDDIFPASIISITLVSNILAIEDVEQ